MLEYADLINDQYVIHQKSDIVINTHWSDQSVKVKLTEYIIWHKHITHLGYRNLKKLTHTAISVKFKGLPSEEICEGCMTEHQHWHIFRISSQPSKEFLEHIYSDIAELYLITCEGHKYMQFFYDEVISLFNIYLLKYKSESLQNFKHYTALQKNQINCCLKIIYTDSAFSDWDDYCKECSINHKISSSYISEQNNKAECFNRTVIRSVKSILYTKKLSKLCWGEIAHEVIYTLNWTSLSDNFKSAFEHLQNKKSYLDHIKVLKC